MNDPGRRNGDRLRPVVAIEVEGLIAVHHELGRLPSSDRWPLKVNIYRDMIPEEAWDRPRWDEDDHWVRWYWISRTGVDWVQSLLGDGIDVVWISQWHGAANTCFGEPTGLPELDSVREKSRRGPFSVAEFETSPLRARSDGRPLLLVTRVAPGDGGQSLVRQRRPRDRAITALRTVSWEMGPTPEALAEIDQWLTLASDPAGQEALRDQRRCDLARSRRRASPTGEIQHRVPQWEAVERIIARDQAINAWVEEVVDNVRKALFDRGLELSDLGTPAQAAGQIIDAMKVVYRRNHDQGE
ncbi:hypothetical protein [Microbacterium oleivorans]|uniref:Uncharacterized protein n=1 Tax=Microbacterium oleivorans TaxID=273677 RepID=A0A4R5YL56_9MICO|nr:hypothetical protein [Microbacterium oleivorans]TDL45282.1 hypothetical protein E2R54_02115 [Microbacterium oleivorans]